ncbi:hypothetical protein CEE69_30025 [Rhodopirellula bahusiensis]|uniref:Uncharacterized protein n=1 Tax=Rhodopirellula bahusiensis TaxID=2014065 RepID=A0A2G1VY13_9BACT|nr:hypothetical protein CEE69_30025 [Rhodopirellula bahusiensis]
MPARDCKPRPDRRLPSSKLDVARFESSSQLSLEVDCEVLEVVSHRLGFQAFLHPTSFESRLRWEYKRFKARHPLPRNYQCLISGD